MFSTNQQTASPAFKALFEQSPSLTQKEQQVINLTNTNSCWSIIKKDTQTPRKYSTSPQKRMQTPNKYDISLFRRCSAISNDRQTDIMYDMNISNQENVMLNSNLECQESFRSSKFLNFGEQQEKIDMNGQVALRDVLGGTNCFFSPCPPHNEKILAQTNMTQGSLISPMIKPFTPTSVPFNERLMKSGSTAASDLISDDDCMISPVRKTNIQKQNRQCFEKQFSFVIRQLSLNQNEEFLIRNNQNFMETQSSSQKMQEFKEPHTKDNKLVKKAVFGDSSILKLPKTKCSQPKKQSKFNKKDKICPSIKRTKKCEQKHQTLLEKLTRKKSQQLEILSQAKPVESSEDKPVTKKCTCSKSKCLKLYCECFASGQPCGPDCGCKECCNHDGCTDLIQLAKEDILKRDPNAFVSKVTQNNKRLQHRKGCTCKKSGCLKGYCECFQMGVSCTEWCKCSGCSNCESTSSNNKCQKKKAKL